MGQKILQLQERLQELISSDVFRRVVHTLLRLADEYGEQKGDGIFIGLPMTNRDFANMVGTSRESVNRVLNQLKKRQLLDIDRKGILIYDLEALRLAE
jgi:CRP/FNR family cyclic AMP-dependent transcriptional regulator